MQALQRAVGEKRRDDVFFFILIDFLLQILFFGLFLFVVYQAGLKRDQEKMKEAVDAAGVSDITQLTDDLTRLAPLKLRELNDLIKQLGGPDEVKRLLKRAQQEGGAQVSISKLDKLRKLAGADKPSCQFEVGTGKPKALMTVLAMGRALTIKAGSPELTAMAGQLAGGVAVGQSMSPDSFERTFTPLLTLKPNCRYFIKFEERTDLVAPRRAADRVFYLIVGWPVPLKLNTALRDMEAHVRAAFKDDKKTQSPPLEYDPDPAMSPRRTLVGAFKSAVAWLLSRLGLRKR